jgi:hypothetical protein
MATTAPISLPTNVTDQTCVVYRLPSDDVVRNDAVTPALASARLETALPIRRS